MKKISEFLSENFQFLVVKFSIYLNRPDSIMKPRMLNLNSNNLDLFLIFFSDTFVIKTVRGKSTHQHV